MRYLDLNGIVTWYSGQSRLSGIWLNGELEQCGYQEKFFTAQHPGYTGRRQTDIVCEVDPAGPGIGRI